MPTALLFAIANRTAFRPDPPYSIHVDSAARRSPVASWALLGDRGMVAPLSREPQEAETSSIDDAENSGKARGGNSNVNPRGQRETKRIAREKAEPAIFLPV